MAGIAKKTELTWALIGDLVDSREQPPEARAAVQVALKAALDAANAGGDLLAEFALTAGDEFEALAAGPGPLFDAILAIDDALQGTAAVRFGLGVGSLATPLPGPAEGRAVPVGELDGPCFHAARRAVERVRDLGAWLALEGEDGPLDPALEALAELIGIQRASWTEKQALTVRLARTQKQQDVADQLGVSPSVISERLKATHFDALLRAERALAAALGSYA